MQRLATAVRTRAVRATLLRQLVVTAAAPSQLLRRAASSDAAAPAPGSVPAEAEQKVRELAATVARDAPRWAELIRLSGAKVE